MSTFTVQLRDGMAAIVDTKRDRTMRRRRFVLLGPRKSNERMRPTVAAGDVNLDLSLCLDWGSAGPLLLEQLRDRIRQVDMYERSNNGT